MDVSLGSLIGLALRLLSLLWRPFWLAMGAARKLMFPIVDLRSGIKQSRMRYYLVEVSTDSTSPLQVYQEVDSNGNARRYVFEHGERFVPPNNHGCVHLDSLNFKFPSWARMDWNDIFSGDKASGCWGISER